MTAPRPPDAATPTGKSSVTVSRLHNGHVLAAAGFLVPVLAVHVPLALAPLIMVAAAVAVAVGRLRHGVWPALSGLRGPIAIVTVALLWAAVGFAWSTDPSVENAVKLARLAALIVAGFCLIGCARAAGQEARRTMLLGLGPGLALALVFLAIDYASEGAIRRLVPTSAADWNGLRQGYNRGVTVIALVLWPVLLVAWRRAPLLAVALWGAGTGVIAVFESNAAILAVVAGGLVAAAVLMGRRVTTVAVAVALTATVLAAPFAARMIPASSEVSMDAVAIPNSAYHRLLIWRFTADRIAERPVLGWGFNASRSIPGNTATLSLGAPALPLHPHDAPLQWWLELGLAGGLLGAGLAGHLAWRLREKAVPTDGAASALALLTAASAVAAVGYGIWQSWWIAAMFFAAAFMSAVPRPERADDRFPG